MLLSESIGFELSPNDLAGDLAVDLGAFCALDFLSNRSRFALSLIFLEFLRSGRGDFGALSPFDLEDGRLLGIREGIDPRDDVDFEDLGDFKDLENLGDLGRILGI